MTVRPWRLAHRGAVTAAGVLIEPGDRRDLAARRVLDAWTPGCEVVDLGEVWAVLWPTPRELRADAAPGAALTPLRRADGASLLTSIPLQRSEIDALTARGARGGDVVRARGGVASTHAVTGAPRLDPAPWIVLGDLDLAGVAIPLGDPPRPIAAPGAKAAAPWFASVTGNAVATAIHAAAAAEGGDEVPATLPWWMRAVAWVSGLFAARGAVRRVAETSELDALAGAPADAPEGSPEGAGLAAVARPSWWERLQARVASSLWGARLEKLLGDRQARYLNDVVAMFEEGRLHEALRRAIPLGGDDPDATERPLSWNIPAPRSDLSIALATATTRTAASPPDMHERLKAVYRRAVESLEREGRAEEAAFVLAELLRDPAAAVSLLERHGRFEAAAALADRARMAPTVRVRQWLRAGDRGRAFALARRYRCYEEAATLLDDVDADMAAWLRGEHAQHLARTGDLAGAVRAGERVPAMRARVLAWMDELIARGGPDAARALPGRVLADEGSFDFVRSRVLALCADRDRREERFALARSLDDAAKKGPSEPLETLTRPLIRALVRDAAVSGDAAEGALVSQLARRGADRALAVDLPRWPTFARVALGAIRAAPTAEPRAAARIDPGDRGLRALEDLAMLPDGRALLAFGESGAELWSRAGRRIHRFDEPCSRLVISPHGDRALALAPRGLSTRVARLELDALRASWWADLRLEASADEYDGDAWLVAQDGRVLELDATDPGAGALRVLAESPAAQGITARALDLQRGGDSYAALGWHEDRARGDAHSTQHAWSLVSGASTFSRALDTLGVAASPPALGAVDAWTARVARADRDDAGAWTLTLIQRAGRERWRLDGEALSLTARSGWVCALTRDAEGVTATLYNGERARVLRLLLAGATRAVARLQGELLLLGDDLGRVRVLELRYGGTALDLRV